jgi:hypothetical protein
VSRALSWRLGLGNVMWCNVQSISVIGLGVELKKNVKIHESMWFIADRRRSNIRNFGVRKLG